ncbi:DUF1766-domain-containing protein [Salix suchowensis]|nr:DUF1766-domain-containing protein [Salix suchowensis]
MRYRSLEGRLNHIATLTQELLSWGDSMHPRRLLRINHPLQLPICDCWAQMASRQVLYHARRRCLCHTNLSHNRTTRAPKDIADYAVRIAGPDQQHRPFPPKLNTPPSRPVSSSMLPSQLHDLNLYAAPVTPKKGSKPQAISHSVTISSDSSNGSYTVSPKPSKKAARRRVSSDPPASAAPSTSKGDGPPSSVMELRRQANAAPGKLPAMRTRPETYSATSIAERSWLPADWIPSYLQPDTQVMLRSEMEKAKTSSDVPGYIYTFEILDLDAPTVKLKVGRAVNLVKRIDEWSKQCSSKEQVLRGWYPGVVESEDGDGDGEISLLKGKVRAGTKCPLCHRLERLVHLELADLAFAQVYLDPAGRM